MNLENLVDSVERNAERLGQIAQHEQHPYRPQYINTMGRDTVEVHNTELAARVAALSPELKAARAAAIAKQ